MHSRTSKARPRVESLEDRTLLSTCHVTHLTDQGIGKGFRGDLRYCINKVNAEPGPDVIDFNVTGTINLNNALPNLASDIDIQGPGADLLTVRRNAGIFGPYYRGFTIPSGGTIAISGLTISNGSAFGDSLGNRGGGIYNAGTLVLSACVVSSNFAATDAGGDGGGVYNSGTLTIHGSVLADNTAGGGGGLYIASTGAAAIEYSTISGNTARNHWTAGGGVYNGGVLTVESSTLSGNLTIAVGCANDTCIARGGGIHNFKSATIHNSTISRNTAFPEPGAQGYVAGGGGIYNYNAASLVVANSTVAENASYLGGGIHTSSNQATAYLKNTIVAKNSATSGDGPDVRGNLTSSSYNLFGNSNFIFGYTETDLIDVDPLLGPLVDNGGPTLTMALLPGSPAIDVGDNTDAPEFDQRGPGFPRIVNGTIDIGAFEVQSSTASRAPVSFAFLITADLQDEE